jgi:prepilin-type processing-associated H-X9-DG protein
MLLPAVQAARESARRTQCASQIKQLAMAVLNYESARKSLPPSGIAGIEVDTERNIELFNPNDGLQLSWIVLLLPYLEQTPLSAKFDTSVRIIFQRNNPQAEVLPLLICPSDGPSRARYLNPPPTSGLPPKVFGKGNYAAYTSPFHVDLQMLYRGAFISGGQAMAAIEDGSSNTLAVAEVRTLDRDDDRRGVWAASWPGSTLLAFDMHPLGWVSEHGSGKSEEYVANTNAAYVANPDSVGKTQPPNCQGPNQDTIAGCKRGESLYLAAEAAGMPCVTPEVGYGLKGHMSAAPRSLHPGGVNGAFLDGHVQFLTDDVDDFLMAYAVSINDASASDVP